MTIPDPTPGQVWEDRDPRGMSGRRVRLDSTVSAPSVAGGFTRVRYWNCVVLAHPSQPGKVGRRVQLSPRTLRSKWRFIEEAPK